MHLMTVRAEYDKITNIVIAAVAVYVCYLQDIWYSKAAVSANRIVVLESEFSIIDVLGHSYFILYSFRCLLIETAPIHPQGSND